MTRSKRLLIWLPVVLLPVSNLITGVPGTVSVAWILGAVAEELFFRFFLLKTVFLLRIKSTHAILLVSILFASMHLFNLRASQPLDHTLLQMGCAFCFSVWAGAVTWKSTWLIPVIAHVLMNATAGKEMMWLSLAASAVVLVDAILLIKGERK